MVARATKAAKVLSRELIFQGHLFALKREQVVDRGSAMKV